MPSDTQAPTERFSNRVRNYVKHRPTYPRAIIDHVAAVAGLELGSVVADLGSGTGISSALLVARGYEVYALEPNAKMALAAERRLEGEPRFHSVSAPAENTGLPSDYAHLVTAFQAFHWFDAEKTRKECERILMKPGHAAFVWNFRCKDRTAFMRDYERFLLETCEEYPVRSDEEIAQSLKIFFGRTPDVRVFEPEPQLFDWPNFKGRFLSSSYTPPPGHANHDATIKRLRELFDVHEENGVVRFDYETQVHLGCVN